MSTRQEVLTKLRSNPNVSVLIVGAGINGISVFRELALNGVDVLLVDRADFCSGASAGSSHMVHGGLRYLENAEFRLVREALTERNRLLINAPHYVKPLPTTIPMFKWFSGILNAPLKFMGLRDKPGERGAIIIKLGLMMYDFFARSYRTMPKHTFRLSTPSILQRPQLNRDVIATATYYDAWMPYPERISMELVLDSEALSPDARALNYVSLQGGQGDSVTLCDEVTGETYLVKPKIVVNAAGPWIDFANDSLGQQTHFIGGTKGAHLIIDHPELHAATQGNELFFENKDGRICLFFPLMDKVLAGTTDIRIDDPDEAAVTDEEVDYILGMVKLVFPSIEINRSNIVFWFTGVRPLPSSDASTAGQISRDHSIRITEPNSSVSFPVFSLVGGKWTSFRAFGEQTADKLFERLGKKRHAGTEDMPIGGGKDYPRTDAAREKWLAALQAETGLSEERIVTLFARYGTHAADIVAYCAAGDDALLVHHPDYSRREIAFLVEQEKVVHLDDLLLRRSLMAMLGEVNGDLLAELAPIVGEALGWSPETIQAERERAADLLTTRHGVSL
ncbi:MAG: glycerol-3-phosphate dehydrogenase/oxidase [Anaerolineaceae bacterium]|nr:glycerol-3-phosphate dehydrogenase/oxidase [Anaerolineaceae bacterium]